MLLLEKIISEKLQKKPVTVVQPVVFRGLEERRVAFHSFVLFQFLAMCVDQLLKIFKQECSKINILKLVSKESAFPNSLAYCELSFCMRKTGGRVYVYIMTCRRIALTLIRRIGWLWISVGDFLLFIFLYLLILKSIYNKN